MPHLSLSGHAALVLWAQVALLLTLARLLGALVRRWGQPDIVGSLIAGLLLGPSVLGTLWPAAERWLVPVDNAVQGELLAAVSGFSLLVLLVVLGAETDLGLLRSLGRGAATVSTGSILLPGTACVLTAWLLGHALMPSAHNVLLGALAVGGAVSVSSLPVVARIVQELRISRRNYGQLAIAAATVNDVYGFAVLVVVSLLANSTGVAHLLRPVVGLVVLTLVLAVVGQRVVDDLLRRVRAKGPNVAGSLSVSLAFAVGAAAVAQSVEVDAALGAFAAGVVLGRSRFQHGEAMRHIDGFTTAVFAPLYFATAGLQVNLRTLSTGSAVGALVLLLVVGVVSKMAGVLGGTAAGGLPAREGVALGVLLNGRGAMQVIIGSAALRLGVIGEASFTALLVISIITSVSVSPLLRRVVGGWPGTTEEQERLQHEEQLRSNVIVRGQRLLLPTRGGRNALTAALVMDRAWPPESELTLLTIDDGEGRHPDIRLPGLSGRPLRRLRVSDEGVLDALLAEANLGYGVIGLGTVDEPTHDRLLPPVVSELLNRSPLPLLIVRRARDAAGEPQFRRIAVPVTGTAASRAGQEVAHNLSRRNGAALDLLHVVTRPGQATPRRRLAFTGVRVAPARADATATGAADAVLDEALGVAAEQGVTPGAASRHGQSAGEEIVAYVRERGADVVVLGTRVRRVGGRPFLGHSVEHVLEHARDTMVVVVVLPDADAVTAVSEPYADRQSR